MTEPQLPPCVSYTDQWLARIDSKLGLLLDRLGGGDQPAPAPGQPVELIEPARPRQRTRSGKPA